METLETRVQALRRRNRFLLFLTVVACLALAGMIADSILTRELASLRASWNEENLHLVPGKDGPVLVTHLFRPGTEHFEASVAQLPQPIIIIDSRGHWLSIREISSLTWIGASGETNAPPPAGSPLRALYTVPKLTR